MAKNFVSRFAVGADGGARSLVWRVWADKPADLYCGVRSATGELKSSIHAPRPPEHPNWERKWGFGRDAKTDVAKTAKADGGPHKLRWTGVQIGPEVSLEWRIIFKGSSLRSEPLPVDDKVLLLPVPAPHQQLEVVVMLGPKVETVGFPRAGGLETHLVEEGRLPDGRRVWLLYVRKDLGTSTDEKPKQMVDVPKGKGFLSPSVHGMKEELRSTLVGVQHDGSLAFWDVRADLDGENQVTIST
jgi:hypothetical protein